MPTQPRLRTTTTKAVKLAFLCLATISPAHSQTAAPFKSGLYATFSTSLGSFTAQLFEKDVPRTVKNFVGLAQGTRPWYDPTLKGFVRKPLYDHITFHRVTPGVMIQTGDPTGKGNHNCGVKIADEFLPGILFNGPGRLAMANTGSADSGGCQFFITEQPMPTWNGKYTVFGQLVSGQNVVTAIDRREVHNEKPVDPVILNGVSIFRVGPASAHP